MQRDRHLLRQEDEAIDSFHEMINDLAVDPPQESPECRNLVHIIKLGNIRNHRCYPVFGLQFIDSPQKWKICCEDQNFRFTRILLQPRPYLPHSHELFYERDIPTADLMADYIPTGPVRVFQAESLKALGYKTAALALTDDSISIDDPQLMSEEKLAVILGTEGDGLMQETIKACDYTVKIPMSHGVDSLNVAAASAVAFWQLRK